MDNKQKVALIIDDEPYNISIMETDLQSRGYKTLSAEDGLQGLRVLSKNKEIIDVILLDRMMPKMDGMEFLNKVKQDKSIPQIPIIMQTAAAEKKQIIEGIKAGVYYYLTKPYDPKLMLVILQEAVYEYEKSKELKNTLDNFKRNLQNITQCCFEISKFEEISYLSSFISSFYPDSDKVLFGINEIITNAFEHGNLGIGYKEKTNLVENFKWLDEIKKMQINKKYINKKVTAKFERKEKHIELTVKDEGEGFDWSQYMEFSSDRATDCHGRGIAMAKTLSFDYIKYNKKGNEVTCTVLV